MFSRVFHCLTARQIFAANLVSKALDGTNIGRPESLATISLNLELACKIIFLKNRKIKKLELACKIRRRSVQLRSPQGGGSVSSPLFRPNDVNLA